MLYLVQEFSNYLKWCYNHFISIYKTETLRIIDKVMFSFFVFNAMLCVIWIPRILILGLIILITFCFYNFSKDDDLED